MSDVVDLAEAHTQMHLDHAIAAATKPRGPGAKECIECGEQISALRQSLGATRCIDCQRDHELKAGK